MRVQELLIDGGIDFDVIQHHATFGAQRLAADVAVRGQMVAKTVLLRVDDVVLMAVLPATHAVDLHRVKQVMLADSVDLASETEFEQWFPDCEIGALPPFGFQYGMVTLVDETLTQDVEIVFEGNQHDEAIRMRFCDFEQVEQPVIAKFAYHL